jgi:hypothetical protein
MEPSTTASVLGLEIDMQLFTLSITDLTTFESIPHEEWAEKEDLYEIGNRFARTMLAANPDFRHRGMCVAIYDEAGIAVSVMPLDTLQ